MRWVVVTVLFLILASAPALGDFQSFTTNVTEIAAGEPVLIEGSWSELSGSLEIRKNTSPSNPVLIDGATATCSQSTTSTCRVNYTDTPTVTTTYSLKHLFPTADLHQNQWRTVRVVDPAPVIDTFLYDESGAISVDYSVVVRVKDDSLVRSYSLDFGNGDVLTFDCNAASCQKNIDTHRYESPGSYRITLTAIDDANQPTTRTSSLVEISGGLDSDQDGVLDENDACPDTIIDWRPVATSGNPTFIGCSCDEIDPSDYDEPNACTAESCIINGTGGLEILHTPVDDGTSPGNLQGTCIDGQYVAGECGDDPVACFGNRGNEHPYCFDGSTYYEQVDTCGSGEACAVNADGDALCVEGSACLSSPGCRVGSPSNSVVVSGTCDTGRTCYQCQDGFEWTGTSCEESLDCSTYHYLDADGDGQGAGRGQCIEFRDSVTNNLDCNDNNPDAYVGAVELCNNVDNDCDGVIGTQDSFCVDTVYDHCVIDPEVETVWIRDTQLTCLEFENTKTTSFTAINDQCEYFEEENLKKTGASRPLADGTSCPTGFCNDGQCVPVCEHQYLSEKPANSIEVTAQSCSGTNSCYKCANNMIWDGNKCVSLVF